MVAAPCPAQQGVSAKLAVAIEAALKERIGKKLEASLGLAAKHLTERLAVGGDPFTGYELELGKKEDSASAFWRHGCGEIDETRDSVENCALRQLHALAALCDAGDIAKRSKATVGLVHDHLKALVSKSLPSLAVVGMSKFDQNTHIFFHRIKAKGQANDVDASPALQASALMAMVRCADALGEKKYFEEAESWFMGLEKLYPEKRWNSTLVPFHKSGIIWESLALVASHLPVESTFRDNVLEYIISFEGFMAKIWEEDPNAWSFASARALAIRWRSKSLKKKKQRSKAKKWAQEHVDRFLGRPSAAPRLSDKPISEGILARMGGASYTCGPLQGLASLSGILADADLVQVVLQLLAKDVDKYQLTAGSDAPWGGLVGAGFTAKGSFYRDNQQLKLEKRRSIRVDDTVQCVIALTQVLKALETFVAVEIEAPTAAEEGDAAAATADAKTPSEEL